MKPLPSPAALAQLVSNVTKTMLGISFIADEASPLQAGLAWKTAVLPIPGERPLTIGLSSNSSGCAALGAAMFSVKPSEVDAAMVDDSLRELVNMTAGLLKTAMALDQALGLPKVFADPHGSDAMKMAKGCSVVLKSPGVGLVLWVHEGINARNRSGGRASISRAHPGDQFPH